MKCGALLGQKKCTRNVMKGVFEKGYSGERMGHAVSLYKNPLKCYLPMNDSVLI